MPKDHASGDTNEEVIKTFAKELADVQNINVSLQQKLKLYRKCRRSFYEHQQPSHRSRQNEAQMKQLAEQLRYAAKDKLSYPIQTDTLILPLTYCTKLMT